VSLGLDVEPFQCVDSSRDCVRQERSEAIRPRPGNPASNGES
jgi:hypothetical protein